MDAGRARLRRKTRGRFGARVQACACVSCFVALSQTLFFLSVSREQPSAAGGSSAELRQQEAIPPIEDHSPPQPSVVAEEARLRVPRLIHQSWRDGGFPKTLFNWRWQQVRHAMPNYLSPSAARY